MLSPGASAPDPLARKRDEPLSLIFHGRVSRSTHSPLFHTSIFVIGWISQIVPPSRTREVLIRWMRLEAHIVDRPAHGEVVEHLEPVAGEPEHPVCEVVEKASDAGATETTRFGFEVEDLTDDARLPIQAAVVPRAERLEGRAVLGEHRRCEDPVCGDCLIAARLLCDAARIPSLEQEEGQGRRTRLRSRPGESPIDRSLERLSPRRISQKYVQAGR